MNLPRPMKADDESAAYFEHDPNIKGSFFARFETDYAIEPKIDGVRAFLAVHKGETRIIIGSSWSEVMHELPQLYGLTDHYESLTLDGELVIPGAALGTIVGALNSSKRKTILDQAVFYAFDVTDLDGSDLKGMTYDNRRAVLETVAQDFPAGVQLVPEYVPSHEVADAIRTVGFEGFMLKHRQRPYIQKRHASWRKVKWLHTIDCFVTDWQPGKGGYQGLVGALHMSVYDENMHAIEIGKHGVFPEKLRREMTAEDGSLKAEWYGKVMELTYQDTGTNMRLRHPRLYRLRPDKLAMDCELTQLTGRSVHV